MKVSLNPVVGRVYHPTGSFSTLLVAANTFYASPIMFESGGISPDQIGVNVTTAGVGANADVRLGIYSDVGGRPGNLIFDAGAITGLTSTGGFSASLLYNPSKAFPLLPPNVIFWLAAVFNTAATTMPTVAALDSAAVNQTIAGSLGVAAMGNLPSTIAAAPDGVTASLTYGALPAVAPATSVVLNAKIPLVGLRAS